MNYIYNINNINYSSTIFYLYKINSNLIINLHENIIIYSIIIFIIVIYYIWIIIFKNINFKSFIIRYDLEKEGSKYMLEKTLTGSKYNMPGIKIGIKYYPSHYRGIIIELILFIIPSLIILLISYSTFYILYITEETRITHGLSLKIIGHQ